MTIKKQTNQNLQALARKIKTFSASTLNVQSPCIRTEQLHAKEKKSPAVILPGNYTFYTSVEHLIDLPPLLPLSPIKVNHLYAVIICRRPLPTTNLPYYAFLILGCDTQTKQYCNYVYNILVALLTLLSFFNCLSNSKHDTIHNDDICWLKAMNIKYTILPKQNDTSFYTSNMDKFCIPTLEQYNQVLFLDGDVKLTSNYPIQYRLPVSLTNAEYFQRKQHFIWSCQTNKCQRWLLHACSQTLQMALYPASNNGYQGTRL